MTFYNLTAEMQSLVQLQADQTFKFIFFFATILLSIYYIFYHKKYVEQETPFFTVGIVRTLVSAFSWMFMILSPLALLLLDPKVSFYDIYTPFLYIYFIILIVVIIVILADFIYYAPQIMLKWSGVKSDNPKVVQVNAMLEKLAKRR